MRLLSIVCLLLALPALADEPDNQPIPGLGPTGPTKKLFTGFEFTEGPAADAQGNVYFSDIPATTIYKIGIDGSKSVFTDNSRHANGLMFNSRGELVACEMDGQVVAWNINARSRRLVAETYEGKRFNAPNDLVIDRQDGVYFTDPAFRAPTPLPQGKTAVYYADPQGKVTRLIDNLPNPNGVRLTPDEKTLYVIPSGQAEMMAYPVDAPGKLGSGKVFCTLQQPGGKTGSGGDGLAIDSKGNVYIASQLGLQVYDPLGKRLGILRLSEVPANVTFGGPEFRTLYVTARKSLYTIPMDVRGHRFATPRN
jgi:gluconolactonase